jgi:uncharacterized membrane protein YphA (DoxX/SURF4 family)
MSWRIISIIALIFALFVAVIWFAHGMQVFTKDKEQIITRDELFGTESITWKPTFKLGLDYAVPALGGLIIISGGSHLIWKKKMKKGRLTGKGM